MHSVLYLDEMIVESTPWLTSTCWIDESLQAFSCLKSLFFCWVEPYDDPALACIISCIGAVLSTKMPFRGIHNLLEADAFLLGHGKFIPRVVHDLVHIAMSDMLLGTRTEALRAITSALRNYPGILKVFSLSTTVKALI